MNQHALSLTGILQVVVQYKIGEQIHWVTHVDIDYQNGASKIIRMMTSGELGQ